MAQTTVEIGPFRGINRETAPEYINISDSPDCFNVITDDSTLKMVEGSNRSDYCYFLTIHGYTGTFDQTKYSIHHINHFKVTYNNTVYTVYLARLHIKEQNFDTLMYYIDPPPHRGGATGDPYNEWREALVKTGEMYDTSSKLSIHYSQSCAIVDTGSILSPFVYNDWESQNSIVQSVSTPGIQGQMLLCIDRNRHLYYGVRAYKDGDTVDQISLVLPQGETIANNEGGTYFTICQDRAFVAGIKDKVSGDMRYNALRYSREFDPLDFRGASEGEAAGSMGGEIIVDEGGERIIGIYTFADEVIIFKEQGIFRLSGVDGADYRVTRIPTALYPREGNYTAVQWGNVLYYLCRDGIAYFDGTSTGMVLDFTKCPVLKDRQDLAILFYDQCLYVLEFNEETDTITWNSEPSYIIRYHIKTGVTTLLQHGCWEKEMDDEGIIHTISNRYFNYRIRYALIDDGKLLYTLGTEGVYELFPQFPVKRGYWMEDERYPVPARWTTPVIDANSNNIVKTLETLRIFGSCEQSINNLRQPGELKITPTVWKKRPKVKRSKVKKLGVECGEKNINLNGEGERFQLAIESVNGSVFNISSMQVELEMEEE